MNPRTRDLIASLLRLRRAAPSVEPVILWLLLAEHLAASRRNGIPTWLGSPGRQSWAPKRAWAHRGSIAGRRARG